MKKRYSRTLLIATAALAATSTHALANPNGGSVVAGQATIAHTAPAQVTITQSTDKAIINWNSFSIGAGEKTRFVQPSSNAITLNRVTGPDVSQILGQLTANGRIVLVNPNGVFFGKDSQVDVAALIATSHDIKNDDFMAGKLNFTIPGKPGAQIINQGKITVQEGGLIALVAPSVQNSGLITARLGKLALASANSFTIDLYGDNLILFDADSAITSQLQDALGNPLSAAVENSGAIEANGGWVLLTAEVAKNVVDKAINMTGHIKATTVDQQEGTIILKAMGGEVAVTGTLDASAPNGGDGGFIETSGAQVTIDPAAKITTAAPWGSTGRWLIDPTNYYIAASGGDITGATLASYLGNSNVEIQTATTGGEAGDIYVNDNVTWYNFNKLTLSAHRNIYVNKTINANGGGSVLLRADNTGTGVGTVAFGGTGHITATGGAVGIYYNSLSWTGPATRSDNGGNPYSGYVTGGTLGAFMLVNNVNQLQAMNTNLAGHYALGRDIDASTTAGWNGGAGFVPVATWYLVNGLSMLDPFIGAFNGLDHVISGLTINTINTLSANLTGLFGTVGQGGVLRNVRMQDFTITGGLNVGGLVGYNNGTINNSYAAGGITCDSSGGGLVGYNVGAINNSYSSSNVTGTNFVGGLVGLNGDSGPGLSFGTINNSYATGNVSGTSYVGGLVGNSPDGGAFVGGVYMSHTINNAYATGSVMGISNVGGLVGGGVSFGTSNSYWNINLSGQATSTGGTGLTTVQMKQQASYAGWDFTNIWTIQNGVSYPTLRTASGSAPATTLLRPDGVVYGPSTGTIITQYQNTDAATLLGGIYAGDLRNDRQDPVWRALYVNGTATAAQIEANALENHYRNVTANDLVNELKAGTRKSDGTDPVWNVLPLEKRNAALELLNELNRPNDTPSDDDTSGGGGTTGSGGSTTPLVVPVDNFLQALSTDPAASLEQLHFDGFHFTFNGSQGAISVSSGYLLEKLFISVVEGAAMSAGMEIVSTAIFPQLAAVLETISMAQDAQDAAAAGSGAAQLLDGHLSTEAAGSAVVGFNNPLLNSVYAGNGTDNIGAYAQFAGRPGVYETAVAQGLMTVRLVDGFFRYYTTTKGAIAYYLSQVPPKAEGIYGFRTYTYEGVQQKQTLLSQLIQGVAKL